MTVCSMLLHVAHRLEATAAYITRIGLVTCVDPYVHFQFRVTGEVFPTVGALIGAEPCVCLHVSLQGAVAAECRAAYSADDVADVEVDLPLMHTHIHLAVKGLVADVAGMGSNPSVDHLVCLQDALHLERGPTLVTEVGAQAGVALHVYLQVTFHHKRCSAQVAAKRTLECVLLADVDRQQAALFESFPTLFTLVRALLRVRAHVLLQSGGAGEGPATDLAAKRLFPCVLADVGLEVGRGAEGSRALIALVSLSSLGVVQLVHAAVGAVLEALEADRALEGFLVHFAVFQQHREGLLLGPAPLALGWCALLLFVLGWCALLLFVLHLHLWFLGRWGCFWVLSRPAWFPLHRRWRCLWFSAWFHLDFQTPYFSRLVLHCLHLVLFQCFHSFFAGYVQSFHESVFCEYTVACPRVLRHILNCWSFHIFLLLFSSHGEGFNVIGVIIIVCIVRDVPAAQCRGRAPGPGRDTFMLGLGRVTGEADKGQWSLAGGAQVSFFQSFVLGGGCFIPVSMNRSFSALVCVATFTIKTPL